MRKTWLENKMLTFLIAIAINFVTFFFLIRVRVEEK